MVEIELSSTDAVTSIRRPSDLHPGLATVLESLSAAPGGVPDVMSWDRLLLLLDEQWHAQDRLAAAVADGRRAWSSFENLFRASPVPTMEQDYSVMVRWMEGLRASGVTSIREFIDGDMDLLRSLATMIRIVAANPAASEAVGLPVEEMLGPVDPKIVNPGAEEAWMGQFEAVWERRPLARSAFVAATATGRMYDAESILSAPVVDGEPDFSRAVFTLIDVTGLRDEERRMRDLVAAKNRFLATVSHEIRTPLTAITGFADLLVEAPGTPDDQRAMVESIASHAREVATLIEDLLVASQGEGVVLEVAEGRVDLAAEVVAVLAAGGAFTETVRVDPFPEDTIASGDGVRLRQIVRNLLTTAHRHGGADVRIRVLRDAAGAGIDVVDNGPGVPAADRERIFDQYQTASRHPYAAQSMGIGLTVSRQLAQLMGGTLEYRRDGDLSVFSLRLPDPE